MGEKYDIIFADPPYSKVGRLGALAMILDALQEGDMLSDNGIFIMQEGSDAAVPEHACWDLIDERIYGRTVRRFLRKKRGEV